MLVLPSHGAISIVKGTIHSLSQYNQNEKQHDFFGHMTQLLFPFGSHDATGAGVTYTIGISFSVT